MKTLPILIVSFLLSGCASQLSKEPIKVTVIKDGEGRAYSIEGKAKDVSAVIGQIK